MTLPSADELLTGVSKNAHGSVDGLTLGTKSTGPGAASASLPVLTRIVALAAEALSDAEETVDEEDAYVPRRPASLPPFLTNKQTSVYTETDDEHNPKSLPSEPPSTCRRASSNGRCRGDLLPAQARPTPALTIVPHRPPPRRDRAVTFAPAGVPRPLRRRLLRTR